MPSRTQPSGATRRLRHPASAFTDAHRHARAQTPTAPPGDRLDSPVVLRDQGLAPMRPVIDRPAGHGRRLPRQRVRAVRRPLQGGIRRGRGPRLPSFCWTACPRSAGQRLLAGGLRRAGARLPRNRRHLPVPVAGGVLTATGTESTSLGPPRLSPEGEKPARWDQRITYPASGIGTRPERDLTLGDPPCLVFLMGDINGHQCLGEGSLTEATLMRRGDEYQDQTRLGRTGSRSRL